MIMKKARQEYVVRAEEQHETFVITNPKFPHLSASPDGLIACDCCVLRDKVSLLQQGWLTREYKFY